MKDVDTASFALSCVILTRGDRPNELARAIESIRAQHGEPIQLIVVANGADSVHLPVGVELIELAENVGVPGGRNIGTSCATGDAVIYLDDDGWWPDRGSAEHLRRAFLADDRLAVVSFRILDPETGRTERRHVPRLRVGDPERSSYVTTFLGGACAVRRTALEECGEFPDHFFYSHEETDFAWRALEHRYRIRYDAGMLMYHPSGSAFSRNARHYYYNARNRVLLARKRLPPVLRLLYVINWTVATILRQPRLRELTHWFTGLRDGYEMDAQRPDPISYRTVVTMLKLGRPPII